MIEDCVDVFKLKGRVVQGSSRLLIRHLNQFRQCLEVPSEYPVLKTCTREIIFNAIPRNLNNPLS